MQRTSVDPSFKVLHVIETLGQGGAERLLVMLLPELERQGLQAEIVVLREPHDLKAELEVAGILVHVLPKRHEWSLLRAAFDLARLAREREADIVHAHLYFPTVMVALVSWLGLWRGMTAATFHNQAYDGANDDTWKLRFRKGLARFLVPRGIDLPVGVSWAVAARYKMVYGFDTINVVHNPIDLKEIRGVRCEAGNAIVLPGRLVHEKGHLDLIEAYGWLPAPKPPLTFVGGGPMKAQILSALSRTGIRAEMCGALPHDQMLEVVARAGMVIVPSRFEGFGLTALEALALGKPVIASDAGGLPEVMGDVGRIVPRSDPHALADTISECLADEEWRREQGTRGPERAKLFDLPVVAARQIELYETALQARGSA